MNRIKPVGDLDALIRAIRACFRELRVAGDALHQDAGVSTAMRAVMEYVQSVGPATVPDIARAKAVSRQNIQVLVDALLKRGLAEMRPNPAHRRSTLVALTKSGTQVFRSMRKRELELLEGLAEDQPAASLRVAREVLSRLLRDLEARRVDVQSPKERKI